MKRPRSTPLRTSGLLALATVATLASCAHQRQRTEALQRRASESARQRDDVVAQRDAVIAERDAEIAKRRTVEASYDRLRAEVAKVRLGSIVPRAWRVVVEPSADSAAGRALEPFVLATAVVLNRPLSGQPEGSELLTALGDGRSARLGRSSASVRAQRDGQALPWAYLTISGEGQTTGLVPLCSGEAKSLRVDLKVDGEDGAAPTRHQFGFEAHATFEHGGHLGFAGSLRDQTGGEVAKLSLLPAE